MLHEILAALLTLVALTIVGFPLSLAALRFARQSNSADTYAFAFAPAAGISLFALLAWPLYRLFGKSSSWGGEIALVIVTISVLFIVILAWRSAFRVKLRGLEQLTLIGALALVFALLTVPVLAGGFNLVVFNGNPSDTITYLSLAESTRTASYEVIRAGRDFSVTVGSERLVQLNPVGLYSSRFVGVNARMATVIDMGWFAQTAGLQIGRSLWAFATVMSCSAAAAAYGLMRIIGAKRFIATTVSVAIVLGFWGAMPREGDAYSQLQVLPVMLMLVAVRILAARSDTVSPSAIVSSGLLGAAYLVIYPEFMPLLIGALIVEQLALFVADTTQVVRRVRELLLLAAVVALSLICTSQLGYLVNVLSAQLATVSRATGPVGSFFYEVQSLRDPVTTIAGLPWGPQVLREIGAPGDVADLIGVVLGIATIVLCFVVAADVQLRKPHLSILTATAGMALSVAGYGLYLKHDPYIFQKAMVSGAPAALILVAHALRLSIAPAKWRPWIAALAGVLLTIQSGYAAGVAIRASSGERASYVERYHVGRDYDFRQITEVLNRRCQEDCKLLVYVPPSKDWWWATFVALSFATQKPYYQMGHFFDNKPATIIFPKLTPTVRPHFAVVDARSDYFADEALGRLLAESAGLRLYEITAGEMTTFRARPVDPKEVRPAPAESSATSPKIDVQWNDIEHPTQPRPVADAATRKPLLASRVTLKPRHRVTVVWRDMAVQPGDSARTSMQAWAQAPTEIRVILARHCNQDRESYDAGATDVKIGPSPSALTAEVTFTQPYDCIRTDVFNPSEATIEFFLTAPTIERVVR